MNKKKWIIVIVILVVVAAVVGVVIGRVTSGQVTPATSTPPVTPTTPSNPSNTEPDKYALTSSVAVSSTIPSETAKLLEITYKYDEGWAAAGMLIIQSVIIKNNSDRSIDRAYISLRIFDGKSGTGNELLKRSSFIGDVSPGKTGSTGLGGSILLENLKNPRSFVITLESVTWKGTTSPTPTPPATISPAEGSPGKLVKDFYQAWIDGRYDDFKKYLSSSDLQKLSSVANGYQQWIDILKQQDQSNPIKSIEILQVDITDGGKKANVYHKVYYKNGSNELGMWLILEGTNWKVVVWQN